MQEVLLRDEFSVIVQEVLREEVLLRDEFSVIVQEVLRGILS